MSSSDILLATRALVDAFGEIGIRYFIGGSVASSVHGLPRTTLDVDVVADIRLEQVDALVRLLQDTFYVDSEMIVDAVQRQMSFNAIHLATLIKLDVFVLKSTPYDGQAFERAQPGSLALEHEGVEFRVASPEDVVLHKLYWYKSGGEISERQWNDVLGVFKVQAETLDLEYLKKWASELQIEALLQRALQETGLDDRTA